MKWIILLLLPLTANAFNVDELDLTFDFGVGHTWATKGSNSEWFQEGNPYTLNLESMSWQLGVTWKATQRLYLSFGYKHLGDFGSYCACYASDAAYWDWYLNDGPEWPLSEFYTKSKIHGIYFKPKYNIGNFFISAGVYLHETKNKAYVPNIIVIHKRTGEVTPKGYWEREDEQRYHFGGTIGLGYNYKNVSVEFEVLDIRAGRYPSVAADLNYNLSVTYGFEL